MQYTISRKYFIMIDGYLSIGMNMSDDETKIVSLADARGKEKHKSRGYS